MDPSAITSIIIAIITLLGLPLALKSRKKTGPKKVEELHKHLQMIGIKAYILENDILQPKKEKNLVVTIKLMDKNIDSMKVTGVATQYGVQYYLDYQVMNSSLMERKINKKTKMIRKKSPALWGKAIDIEWKGDYSLAQKLNLDYQLKDRLLQSAYKGSVEINIMPKDEYTRIRTAFFLPDQDFFEAMDIIARHIRLW